MIWVQDGEQLLPFGTAAGAAALHRSPPRRDGRRLPAGAGGGADDRAAPAVLTADDAAVAASGRHRQSGAPRCRLVLLAGPPRVAGRGRRALAAADRERRSAVAALRRLPTVTEVVDGVRRTGSAPRDYYLDLGADPDPHPQRLRPRRGRWRRPRHPARPLALRSPTCCGPLFEVARPIPAIALVPVAILLFPTDEGDRVHHLLAAFFPILVSTRHAVRALPTVWEDAVLTMGGNRAARRGVVLPGIAARRLRRAVGRHRRRMDLRDLRRDDLRATRPRLPHLAGVHDRRTTRACSSGCISIGVLGWLTSAAVELVGRRAHPLAAPRRAPERREWTDTAGMSR